MKKFLPLPIIILLLFSSLWVNASHNKGGIIYWECQGNGQYIFMMDLFKDAALGTASLPSTTFLTGPSGSISVTRTLFGLRDTICGDIEVHHYESAPTTLSGTPPTAGWSFEWSNCCRAGTVVNAATSSAIHLRSVMYPGGSGCHSSPEMNVYKGLISSGKNTLNLSATAKQAGDSIYYRLDSAMTSANSYVNYDTGYSGQNPFPNSYHDSLNQDAALNPITGLLTYGFSSGTLGDYILATSIECWRAGQLASRLHLEIILEYNGPLVGTEPYVRIDTALFKNVQHDSTGEYNVSTKVGDTLRFNILASDFDFNPNGSVQEMTFTASGAALEAPFGGALFNSNAKVSPIAPQQLFTSKLNNNINFEWVIGAEHLSGNGRHFFVFNFADDLCRQSSISVQIEVESTTQIPNRKIHICLGDSAILTGQTLSGTYQWSPNYNISNDTISSPEVSPDSTTTYYLTDTQNPILVDSITVVVEPRSGFHLVSNGTQLQLQDSTASGTITWYYNGLSFFHPFDTLTPFGPGQYYVTKQTASCNHVSDTIAVSSTGSFSMIQVGNGNSISNLLLPGSLGHTFQLSANGNLQEINLPGVADIPGKTGNNRLRLKIYDSQQNMIWRAERDLSGAQGELQKFAINPAMAIAAGTDYTLVVIGDTGLSFNGFLSVSTPYSPNNSGLTVTGLSSGLDTNFPTGASNTALPLTIKITGPIGLNENPFSEIKVYPNPADNFFFIENLENGQTIQLIDLQSRLVLEKTARGKSEKISRKRLKAGVYLLKISSLEGTQFYKIILK